MSDWIKSKEVLDIEKGIKERIEQRKRTYASTTKMERKISKSLSLKHKIRSPSSLFPKQKQVSLRLGHPDPNLYMGRSY